VDLRGQNFVVTGANGGLGYATARALAILGGRVYLFCRNPDRARAAQQRMRLEHDHLDLPIVLVDMGDLNAVDAAAEHLEGVPLDGLIHNAGLMPPGRKETVQGFELTYAVHLLGPLRLTWRLLPNLRRAQGRVVFVSSGGMYSEQLDVDGLQNPEPPTYEGIKAYARTKRAQVELADLLAERLAPAVDVHAMHPGWADTPGVQDSMPRFYKFTRGRLRTAAQGADTTVWLAASKTRPAPGFYFDRQPAPMTLFGKNATPPDARAALLPTLCAHAQVPLDAFGG
jgi:NAD(P)-dependent dehydrogenase (short-subunit alcohol dehydrogenase family)